MKARNREINIFNMSLLDILCGALGAFCFLMLVLFPFYSQDKGRSKAPEVPPGVDPKNYEEALARIKQLEDTLKKFQDYSAQLEAQTKQLQAKNGQMQQRIEELEKKVQQSSEKVGQYEFRNPFLATMDLSVTKDDDLELYIEDDRGNEKGPHSPKADLSKRQGVFWNGDFAATSAGGGSAFYMVRDGPPGEYHVVLKVMKHNPAGPPISGTFVVGADKTYYWGGIANLNKDRVIVPIAMVQIDKDYKQVVKFEIPQEFSPQTVPRPRFPEPSPEKGKK